MDVLGASEFTVEAVPLQGIFSSVDEIFKIFEVSNTMLLKLPRCQFSFASSAENMHRQ